MVKENQPREIKPVQLANGAIEADVLVEVTMFSLRGLIKTNPIAFYELVTRCRDEKHKLFGNTEEVLMGSGLIQKPGEIHDSVRNIVLSAAKGDGFEMTLGSPFPLPSQDPK